MEAAKLERLVQALVPFAEVASWAERNGHDLEHYDMLLRHTEGPELGQFAGHLHVQSPQFIEALAALRDADAGALVDADL